MFSVYHFWDSHRSNSCWDVACWFRSYKWAFRLLSCKLTVDFQCHCFSSCVTWHPHHLNCFIVSQFHNGSVAIPDQFRMDLRAVEYCTYSLITRILTFFFLLPLSMFSAAHALMAYTSACPRQELSSVLTYTVLLIHCSHSAFICLGSFLVPG